MVVSNIFLFVLLNLYVVQGDNCQYSTNDGTLDLRLFGYKDRPKYTDMHDTTPRTFLTYSFNGCFPYSTKDACQNAAACVTDDISKTTSLLARQTNRDFSYNQGVSTIIYTDGGDIKLQVFLVCGVDEVVSAQKVNDKLYIIHIESKCACPGKCTYTPDKSPNGLTGGAIFLIVFVSILVTYLLVTVVFLRFVKHEQGVNLIPHRTFWWQLGSHSIYGVRFVFDKLRGRNSYDNL
ncbi:unnamed protein product [Adineta ricciae]|uniref:MRH domain-containing protein n=1 Tax=Adineta ricciae TaxID=249248 RepID=A0A813RLU5_ADIRI|nr:unnamed protein product [Adineta ricciae]CAF1034192.1 unnamed protein product [Adineta ricciae]